jgi:hypothetical protein
MPMNTLFFIEKEIMPLSMIEKKLNEKMSDHQARPDSEKMGF